MQSNYQAQTSSDLLFLNNRTQTPPKFLLGQQNTYYVQLGTTKRILCPGILVKEPDAIHYYFYPFEIVSLVQDPESLHSDFCPFETVPYKQTKRLTCLQLKTHTRNINILAIER